MKIYPEEIKAHKLYMMEEQIGPELKRDQVDIMKKWEIEFLTKLKKRKFSHNLLNFIVLVTCLSLWIRLVFVVGSEVAGSLYYITAVLAGVMTYSLTILSTHEGATHKLLFLGSSYFSRVMRFLSSNLSRFFFVDPLYYHSMHLDHHNHTGTDKDGAYTNFVWPSRFLITLIPLAGALPFCDYKVHSSNKRSKSKFISECLGVTTIILISISHWGNHSMAQILLFNILFLSVSFSLDRIRETVDHNLLPAGSTSARSLGTGFWAILIGGGPWGQPCHLTHHLCPSLPWYGQIMGHHKLKEILSDEQKKMLMPLEKRNFLFFFVDVVLKNIKYAKKVEEQEIKGRLEHEGL